jgi:hypothetical protein
MKFEKPEYLFIPIALLVISVNLTHYGPSWFLIFLEYLTNPNPDPAYVPIHFVTLAAAWSTFTVCFVTRIRHSHLAVARSFMISASIPFGGTGLFEIIYQLMGRFLQPWAFHMTTFDWVTLIIWTSLGVVNMPLWRLTPDWFMLTFLTMTGFLAWCMVGFPQVTWGNVFEEPVAYFFNSMLKIATCAMFLVPTVHGHS